MNVQQDAIGVVFRVNLQDSNGVTVDLSTATTLQLLAKPPVGSLKTWAATLSSGRVQYETESGDLDESGEWRIQARVLFSDGDDIKSEIKNFTVESNLS